MIPKENRILNVNLISKKYDNTGITWTNPHWEPTLKAAIQAVEKVFETSMMYRNRDNHGENTL